MSTPMPQIVQELARVFHDRDQAMLLLQRSSFPTHLIPEFKTSLSFWSAVAETAGNGALPHGVQPILDEAAKLYPGNAAFGLDQTRSLAAWDPATTAYLLAPPGASPTIHVLARSDEPSSDRLERARPQWLITLHFEWVGSSSATSTSLGTVSLIAIVTTITALAVKMLSQDPLASSSDPSTHERSDDSSSAGIEDGEPETLERSARSSDGSRNAPPSKPKTKMNKRNRRTGRRKAERKPSSSAVESKPWTYSIYNCIVGPDEADDAAEQGGRRPNQKGQCYSDDRRIFFLERTSPAAGTSSEGRVP